MVILVPDVYAISIGTAPGVMDLGEVKPGQEVFFKFYLLTNSPDDLVVSLSPIRPHQEMYQRNQTARYKFIPAEASQRDISSWIKILKNPVLVSPTNVKVVYLPNGGVVRANAEVDVKLTIPEDAEPCYYAYGINLSPRFGGGGPGVGTLTIGVTRFIFVFKVMGEATRKAEIINIFSDRESENKARVDVLVRNTGTCTFQARVESLRLYDDFGNHTKTLSSGYYMIEPNEIKILSSYWNGDVKTGKYRTEILVDYMTDSVDGEGNIEIPPIVKLKPEVKKCEFPWFLLGIVVVIGVIILIVRPRYWSIFSAIIFLGGFLMILNNLNRCGIEIPSFIIIGVIISIGILTYLGV